MCNYTIVDETIKNPVVSVAMLAYNHSKYIVEAIESVLMQETDFSIQLVIAEDCSPDNTREIILDYQKKYPHIIKLILQNENVGARQNNYDLLYNLDGKYVAALEGDDFWTFKYKLQKQVEFLENNTGFSFCCHRYRVYFQNENCYDAMVYPNNFDSIENNFEGVIIDKNVYHSHWMTQPLTAVFRKECLLKYDIGSFNFFRDVHIFYFLVLEGKGFCMSDISGVYRNHDGGIHTGATTEKRAYDAIGVYSELYLEYRDSLFFKTLLANYLVLFKNGKGYIKFLNFVFCRLNRHDWMKMIKFVYNFRK